MNKFTEEEMTVIFELARVSLADAEIYDMLVDDLDVSDDFMKALQEKIIN